MSLKAYQKTQKAFSDPRDVEYRLFAQITAALIDHKDVPRTDARLVDALSRNRQLWSVLASDCAAQGNQLPDKLRAQIVSLSLWVTRYTSEVMRARASLLPLIEVNRSIMEGLAARAAAPAVPAGPTPRPRV